MLKLNQYTPVVYSDSMRTPVVFTKMVSYNKHKHDSKRGHRTYYPG